MRDARCGLISMLSCCARCTCPRCSGIPRRRIKRRIARRSKRISYARSRSDARVCGDEDAPSWCAAIGTSRRRGGAIARTKRVSGVGVEPRNPSREWLARMLDDDGGGFRDAFREAHPKTFDAYTCWNIASGAQLHNYGSRIDYFLCDREISMTHVERVGVVGGVAERGRRRRVRCFRRARVAATTTRTTPSYGRGRIGEGVRGWTSTTTWSSSSSPSSSTLVRRRPRPSRRRRVRGGVVAVGVGLVVLPPLPSGGSRRVSSGRRRG